jgi:serine/threonine protein kinase/Tfp pilus assembly protein PilF
MGRLAGEHPEPAAGRGRSQTVPLSFQEARSLKRELLEELRAGWEEGSPVAPEQLLQRWPGDADHDTDVASLLFEDYWQRRQHSDSANPGPEVEDYAERFPAQKDSLVQLLRQRSLTMSLRGDGEAGQGSSRDQGLALPAVGDELFDFRLRTELGRGAFARVFLAEQAALADRPVVLKVSAIDGDEPQTLAQLQHTHIVPIYSVHEDRRAGLRAVCMPYFGGASLSTVLRVLWAGSEPPRSGAQLVAALGQVEGPQVQRERATTVSEPATHAASHSARELLAGLDHVRAAVWLVARLAEALQHAHRRGILHRDIKPSNVLLAADAEPMLLDFNLAQHQGGQAAATLGGTVAYMAPEHLRALARRDAALARQVDHRADIYSLGMVLFEILTGQGPFDQSASYTPLPALIEAMAVERARAAPSLKKRRPDVSWGLESITRKCLAPDPGQRYQQSEHLAEDLRRLLEDIPLRHAPELSWRERLVKWRRRHPRLTTSATVGGAAALMLLIGGAVLLGTRTQLEAAQARLHEAEGAEALQRKADFEAGYQQALCLVNTATDLRDHLPLGVSRCERTLGLYGVLERDDWQAHRDWRRLTPAEQRQLAEKVRELLVLLARGRVALAGGSTEGRMARAVGAALASLPPLPGAPPASTAAGVATGQAASANRGGTFPGSVMTLGEALCLLDRAEAIPGLQPSPALWEDRAEYLAHLGDRKGSDKAAARAGATPGTEARDHYWRALKLATAGKLPEAARELDQALRLDPRHYWSWLQMGICHDELGEPSLALGDFSACIALWPEFAWGHFNRGRVLQQLGKRVEAHADYSAALKCDPDLVYAWLNRGLVATQLGRHTEALADFERAAALGRDDVHLHAGRALALEQLGRHAAADRAFAEAARRDPHNTHALLVYGFAVHHRLPEKAARAFQSVLRREARNPRALYGLGMLAAARARDSREALDFFTRALEADPGFVDARRGRANVLAQLGDPEAARREVDWCVKTDPTGVSFYAAACVYGLGADRSQSEQVAHWGRNQALAWLREALARGYGADRAADDPDLAGLRPYAEFRALLGKTPQRARQPD